MSESTLKITLKPNGPAIIDCNSAEITMPDGSTEMKEGKVVLCRCGASKNKPYCDGAHRDCGFQG